MAKILNISLPSIFNLILFHYHLSF